MNFSILENLCKISAVSGDEERLRTFIVSEIKNYSNEIITDNLGNLIIKKAGKKGHFNKKIMVTSSMDEVGFIITNITKDGFLKFNTVGPINYKVLLGTDDIDFIENEKISDIIYETFMSKKLVNIHDTKTCLDRWIGYIAFIFDIYYNENFEYIKEKDLINRCFDRITYKNADTIDKITKMKKLANEYINERNCS